MTDPRRTWLVRVHEVRSYEIEADSEAQARAIIDEHAEGADLPIGALISVERRPTEVARLTEVTEDPAAGSHGAEADPGLSLPRLL